MNKFELFIPMVVGEQSLGTLEDLEVLFPVEAPFNLQACSCRALRPTLWAQGLYC